MELWIRSQDKERLCKPNNLFIKNNAICCSYNEQSNDTDYLGVYKTKERALEVLDEIENFLYTEVNIINSPYEAADIEVKSKILCNMVKIFEMPKE